MEMQQYAYEDWANGNVIYNGARYILNPFQHQDMDLISLEEIATANARTANFQPFEIPKISKNQKSTHNNHSSKNFKELTLAFSAKFNKKANKFCFVRDELSKLDQLFFNFKEGDIPDIDIYSTSIYGIDLSGNQIHQIREALNNRFRDGNQTYDHIFPSHGPLNKFNADNIFVITDAIGKFYYWLRDLNKLFEKNHSEICTTAN